MKIVMEPIGTVVGGRTEPEDEHWGAVQSSIVLDPERVGADATAGLADFSHIEVLYVFDRVDPATIERGSRHPRGNRAWPKVGILAQRARMRPNRIGASVCELLSVEGRELQVRGLDAADGSPVLDIKPCMVEFAPRGALRQPAWASELMRDYW
ncbi:MAG TPA: SAM-dependent methyltransferase [Acidimicrobiales bacterium]|nr:SAM-dependent methyltransferase [Acidimicrobiales bacterium]